MLRAFFCKGQAGNDTDVVKKYLKSYILFITIVKHHNKSIFSYYLCIFVLWDINILVLLTLFFQKLCLYSFCWVLWCSWVSTRYFVFSTSTVKSLGSHKIFFGVFFVPLYRPIYIMAEYCRHIYINIYKYIYIYIYVYIILLSIF